MTAAERVRRGAELLDRNKPDWYKCINFDTFNVESMTQCVLGQVYGSYELSHANIHFVMGEDYGFNSRYDEGRQPVEAAWLEEVLQRKARHTISLDDAAERGAQLLDIAMPDWHNRIDVNKLDICDGVKCILAQIYGSYYYGTKVLGINYFEVKYGFLCERVDNDNVTQMWKRQIKQRNPLRGWRKLLFKLKNR